MSMMIPSRCHLWQSKDLTLRDLDIKDGFTRIRIFEDDSHFMRSLLKCNLCGQLYFYEFFESIDWEEGNDPQYRTYIPVTSEAEAEQINKLLPIELLPLFPRLQVDWPSASSTPCVKWIKNVSA